MAVVLVCDDEEKIRQLIRKYAEFDGFTVLEAANGLEAVKTCASQPVDIVLMDVMMPNMDGLQTTRRIRQLPDPVKAGIPIIAMTTSVSEKDRIAALASGMDAFEEKPIFIDKLFETIGRFLHPEG